MLIAFSVSWTTAMSRLNTITQPAENVDLMSMRRLDIDEHHLRRIRYAHVKARNVVPIES